MPFKIKIDFIGASLQLQSLELLHGQLWTKVRGKASSKKDTVSDSEFHAGLQNMTQYLYIIRDMASSDSEKN